MKEPEDKAVDWKPQPTQIDIVIHYDRIEMSFWGVHNHADKKGNPCYPPLSGPFRAERFAAAVKIENQGQVPKALATLWRCALLTERILLSGEYAGDDDCLFCTQAPRAQVVLIPLDGKNGWKP